ncbi:MAG: hypothetical protein Q7S58_19410 [Candidatus Binatus sp.]|uniref:hypothetical protein n=1 Tax=Candidatus Binatus sp. TaxID=2811406 RepID=UPI00271722FB|nr:hypothetical protein [Candidatus Binatus sp.]MDO8434571.1 hypothetical protein [Candidatus Binatus sp.]
MKTRIQRRIAITGPRRGRFTILAAAIFAAGCAVAPAPIAHTSNVVATPQPGQLSVSIQAAPNVGDVTPVHVSIANGTDAVRAIVPSQVFALNESGARIAPLPPGEAARQAGSANELKGALASAALSGAAAGAVGAGLGAAVGSAFGAVGQGAIVGTAIGAGRGMFQGAQSGQWKADQQANQQIEALALRPEEVRHNFTASGYVFFPKGSYNQVELLLVDRETGDTEVIREPWR